MKLFYIHLVASPLQSLPHLIHTMWKNRLTSLWGQTFWFFFLQNVFFPLFFSFSFILLPIYLLMMASGKKRHLSIMFSKLSSVCKWFPSRSLLQILAETAGRAPEVIHPGANISQLLHFLYPGSKSFSVNKLLCQTVLYVQLFLLQTASTKTTEHFRKIIS